VLSPVGLFPAAAMGLEVGELLAGAAEVDSRCAVPDWHKNPALALGMCLWLLDSRKAKPIHVFMPYASGLADLADWFRQLWAESLGKAKSLDGRVVNIGPTPVKALGAIDQHSQVQLYAEGPYDKAFVFLGVRKFSREVQIPKAYADMSAFGYLGGHGLGELLDAERQGTEVALTAAGRPNATVFIEEIGERSLGGVIFLLEMATAYAGRLYNVDAFDQPGVEAGKVASYALLGRKGFEAERAKIEQSRPAGGRKTV
jgi:glucose-6-phosphate isomerase